MKANQRDLSQLIELIDEDNIAQLLIDEDQQGFLNAIGEDVCRHDQEDAQTMGDWKQHTETGMELIKPPIGARSQPWENAANFKSPIIQEAAYKFGERASKELLRPKNLVKVEVVGTKVTPDREKQAERVSTYQSYQVNHEIAEWRSEHRGLLYRLPNMGCMFKDTFYDKAKGRLCTDTIHYPNFTVDQNTASMEELYRFTKHRTYKIDDIESFVREKIWVDPQIQRDPDNADERRFLEQYTMIDMDGDGLAEPYLVTVHCNSKRVVRIVACFRIEDIVLRDNDADQTVRGDDVFGDLTDEFGKVEEQDADGAWEQSRGILNPEGDYEIIRVERCWTLTKYGFLPSPDGTFLDVGYYQILSSLIEAINSGTNQLLDAGTLANLQGGWLAKGTRKKMGNDRFKPGEFKETNVTPDKLQSAIYQLKFNEPSQVLQALIEALKNDAQKLVAAADMAEIFGPNTQASTVLGLLDEALSSSTSLMNNVALSMSWEFQVMYRLNAIYMDPQRYEEVAPGGDYREDFSLDDLAIQPTANPENSNQLRRLQVAQLLMDNIDTVVAHGGDGHQIVRNFVELVDPDDVETIIPERTEDFMAAQTANQQAQQAAAEAQQRWFDADSERLLADTKLKTAQATAEFKKIPDELEKLKSEIILNLEKAETEDAQNLINKYTAQLDGLLETFKTLEGIANATNAPEAAGGNPGGTAPASDSTTNIPRRPGPVAR